MQMDGSPDAPAPVDVAPGSAAEQAEVVAGGPPARDGGESVEQPAKVMRIGSMIKQLLEEVRQAPLDEASRGRLREVYEESIRELSSGLSPDLQEELARLALPFADDTPSEAELRVAQASLVGWLEGLFHGIQATLFAQQMAARAQLEEIRQRGLPPGRPGGPPEGDPGARPGTYL
jgi:Bacterial proteasome activator